MEREEEGPGRAARNRQQAQAAPVAPCPLPPPVLSPYQTEPHKKSKHPHARPGHHHHLTPGRASNPHPKMPPSSPASSCRCLFLSLLSVSSLVLGADGAGGGDGDGDAAAMQALRRGLAPPDWAAADHCSWRGVTCGAAGVVTAIELPRRGLRGDFSAAGGLRALARLDLSFNALGGGVPAALGALGRLELLDLSMNRLSGPLPASLGGAVGLKFLNLSNNALSGTIPDDLRDLKELQELQISGNNLTGLIPGWLAGLPGLRVLSAYENALSGPIPPALGLSSKLQVLNLHSNVLEGSIPSSLFDLGNLQVLILTVNRLNGTIPDTIGRCLGLSNVRIGNNRLAGAIPASIGDATSLTYFEADNNELSGGVPAQFARCANLTLLNLAYNRLAGEVPDALGELRNLQELIISGNGLGGEFPRSILRCRNLSKLDLSYNAFRGGLPETICNGSRMQFLVLDHNEFSGGIPHGIGGCSRLLELQLANNNLSGEIPAEMGKIKSLQIALNLSLNHILGPLPRELGRLDKLVALDLSSNEISGEIPGDMRGMLSLLVVNLSNNRLRGAIPAFGPFQKSAASSFSGNAKLCGDPLNVDCGRIYGPNYEMDHRKISYRVALAVVGSCVLIFSVVSLVVTLFMWRERQERETEATKADVGEVVVATPQVMASSVFIESLQQAIDFQSCVKATFKDANALSSGTFSTTYKAVMPSGLVVCVKKLKSVDRAVNHHQTKMIRELERLAHLNHPNLVRPIGYVIYEDVALLLQYHMPNGTLLQLLHNANSCDGDNKRPDWPRLLSIAIDVAEGLAFLHQVATIHLDISSGNIFLNSHYNALLGEVEISKLLDPSKGTASISAVAGTFGYIPPEYAYTMQVTVAGNVYSFGVLLLEILTSKFPADEEFGEGVDLVKWVHSASTRGETPEQIMDPRLSTVSFAWRRQMLAVLKVAMMCTERSPAKRPKMKKVVETLQEAKNS